MKQHRHGPESLAIRGRGGRDLYKDIDHISAERLRIARTRIDMLVCLMWRAFFQQADWRNIWLHLFADGSPQWRGTEMYAVSIDMNANGWRQRRLLPCATLSRGSQDALSKVFAVLWQLFLIIGPSFALLRAACNRVMSITTDSGAERLLSSHRDVLRAFFRGIGGRLAPTDVAQDLLFPQSLRRTGWRHAWDLLLRKGLSMLDWWPGWLAKLCLGTML